MLDLLNTMVDLPNIIVNLPNNMVYLPNTMEVLPKTMVDLLNTIVDRLNTMVSLPNQKLIDLRRWPYTRSNLVLVLKIDFNAIFSLARALFGFFSKLSRLLLKVTKVTTEQQKLPKIIQNRIISLF